jgi:hypothetical protein
MPGFGCSTDLVSSIAAELQDRMNTRGGRRQLELKDAIAEKVIIVNEKLDLILYHMMSEAPASNFVEDRCA